MKALSQAFAVLAPWETPSRRQGRSAWGLLTLAALLFLVQGAQAQEMYLALEAAGQGSYTIDGRFWTPGDSSVAWSALTDYDHLPQFVSSLQTSRVQIRSLDYLMLEQEAVGHALVVLHRHLRVLLKVQEVPRHQITFEDVSHHDFISYSGSWRIEPAAGGGSWVNYHLSAQPNFFAPAFVARKSFRKSAKELLLSVQAEMMRRGNLQETLLCCSQR